MITIDGGLLGCVRLRQKKQTSSLRSLIPYTPFETTHREFSNVDVNSISAIEAKVRLF